MQQFCTNCGCSIHGKQLFCPQCGASLEENEKYSWQEIMIDTKVEENENLFPNPKQNQQKAWQYDMPMEEEQEFAKEPPSDKTQQYNRNIVENYSNYHKEARGEKYGVEKRTPKADKETKPQKAKNPKKPRKRMSMRTKGIIVACSALLAMLTLVLSFMSDAFKFGDKSDNIYMVSVLDLNEVEAVNLLENLDLRVVVMKEASEKPLGTVISQSVNEGKKVKEEQKITLIVSSGADETIEQAIPDVYVPSLYNKSFDQALIELDVLGLLAVAAESAYSDEFEEGKIISQSPEAGEKLARGDLVMVTVSKGSKPFEILVAYNEGGGVSPNVLKDVKKGEDITLMIVPQEGYEVKSIILDGVEAEISLAFTIENVTQNHSVTITFGEIVEEEPEPSENPEGENQDPEGTPPEI